MRPVALLALLLALSCESATDKYQRLSESRALLYGRVLTANMRYEALQDSAKAHPPASKAGRDSMDHGLLDASVAARTTYDSLNRVDAELTMLKAGH